MSLIAGAINPQDARSPTLNLEQSLTAMKGPVVNSEVSHEDPAIREAAEDFEAAFISQMLKFSGLGKALTTGGGEDVAAFTDFYIQNYAEKIVDSGGFGLADKFYEKLAMKEKGISNTLLSGEGLNVRS